MAMFQLRRWCLWLMVASSLVFSLSAHAQFYGANVISTTAGGQVSTTNISVTTGQFNAVAVTSVVGMGGDALISSTTSVSVTSAGTIKFQTGGSQRMVINSSGYVGMGTVTSPAYPLDVASPAIAIHADNTGGGAYGLLADAGGGGWGIFCNSGFCGGNAVWTNNSDERLKKDIRDLPEGDGLLAINKLRPVRFHWKDKQQNADQGEQLGFVAQEVEKIFPEVIVTNGISKTITLSNGKEEVVGHPKNMSYASLVVPLVKAVQELKNLFDGQQSEIDKLKKQNEDMQKQLDTLKVAIGKK